MDMEIHDNYDFGGKTNEEWEAELEYWELPPLTPAYALFTAEQKRMADDKRHAERRIYARFDRLRREAQRHLPALFERDGKACKQCGCTDLLTIDHVVPLSRGGSNELENLQILCNKCNSRKGAKV